MIFGDIVILRNIQYWAIVIGYGYEQAKFLISASLHFSGHTFTAFLRVRVLYQLLMEKCVSTEIKVYLLNYRGLWGGSPQILVAKDYSDCQLLLHLQIYAKSEHEDKIVKAPSRNYDTTLLKIW